MNSTGPWTLLHDGRGWPLGAISVGWALAIGVRLTLPALLPFIRSEFGMGLATAGLLLTVLSGAYALGHLPGGILGDRIGGGNTLLVSTVTAAIALAIMAGASDVAMLFAGVAVYGLAVAFYGPSRFTLLTGLYEDQPGSAVGVTMAAGSLGNSIMPVAAVAVATAASWRLSFGAVVPGFLGAAVAIYRAVPGRVGRAEAAVDEFSARTVRRVLEGISTGPILVLVTIQVLFGFVLTGFAAFYPTYLIEGKGLTPWIATLLFGAFFAASFVVQPAAGYGMDRLGERSTLLGLFGITTAGLWALPFVEGLPALTALTIVLSSLNGFGVVTQTTLTGMLPADMRGTGLGSLKMGWLLIGATSPVIIGVLGGMGHLDGAFLLLSAVATMGLGLTLLRF